MEVKVLVAQLYPTLCNPTDCSLPGSFVHGDSPGKNTGVGCHFLLQGVFPTQGSNPGLPHCRQILYLWATREATPIKEHHIFFSPYHKDVTDSNFFLKQVYMIIFNFQEMKKTPIIFWWMLLLLLPDEETRDLAVEGKIAHSWQNWVRSHENQWFAC